MSRNNILLKIEEKYNLLDESFNGIPIWNIIREVIFFECHAVMQSKETGLPDFQLLSHKDIPYIDEYNEHYLRPESIGNHDVIFITNPRKVMLPTGYYQTIIDPIYEMISGKNDCIILEEPSYVCEIRNAPQHYKPINDDVYFTDIYEHECIDRIKVNSDKVKTISEKVMFYVKRYEDELEIKVSEKICNRLVQRVLFFYFMEDRITELLQAVAPKYVMVYFFPSAFKVLFVYVCKKMGIPIFELQHGLVSEDFPYEHHVLNNNKLQIKSDVYLGFGDLSIYRDDFSHKEEDIINIGFAYLDRQKSKVENCKSLRKKSEIKKILVISQPIISVELMELCDRIYELVGDNYNIIYKQHPLDNVETNFRHKDIIVKSNKDSIYDIYPEVDVVFGASSTAMFEAVYLGIPSVVIEFVEGSKELYPIMKKIHGISFLKRAEDIGEVLRGIEKPNESINKFYTCFSEKKLNDAIDSRIN